MTVADLRAAKGTRTLTMLFVETPDEAAAAAAAGIDILSVVHPVWTPAMREAAGDCFVQVGLLYGVLCTYEDYLRAAHAAWATGGDSFYCSASVDTVRRLAAEGIPVVGHVGLVPHKSTWTGGFRAVGKTAELVTFGMGAGAGTDVQYLFAEDVLGCTRGHRPRHAKVYRDLRAEYDRLQAERVAAFGEFRADVASGAYPGPEHMVPIADAEFDRFLAGLDAAS